MGKFHAEPQSRRGEKSPLRLAASRAEPRSRRRESAQPPFGLKTDPLPSCQNLSSFPSFSSVRSFFYSHAEPQSRGAKKQPSLSRSTLSASVSPRPVPKGPPKIARRFNAGSTVDDVPSRTGRLKYKEPANRGCRKRLSKTDSLPSCKSCSSCLPIFEICGRTVLAAVDASRPVPRSRRRESAQPPFGLKTDPLQSCQNLSSFPSFSSVRSFFYSHAEPRSRRGEEPKRIFSHPVNPVHPVSRFSEVDEQIVSAAPPRGNPII